MNILISDPIRIAAPSFKVIAIEASVTNRPTPEPLWELITRAAADMRDVTEIPDINHRPAILATRLAYKALGKDPNRYRPAAEALSRRVVKGLELYRIDALVDLINLLSLQSGYSIGGFDIDAIDGDTLTLGVGREDEPYEGIGRGQLNIAGMPVYRDNTGGVGTPTSDNERTRLTLGTRRLLICINVYGEEMPIDETIRLAIGLLEQYADATDIKVTIYDTDGHIINISL